MRQRVTILLPDKASLKSGCGIHVLEILLFRFQFRIHGPNKLTRSTQLATTSTNGLGEAHMYKIDL